MRGTRRGGLQAELGRVKGARASHPRLATRALQHRPHQLLLHMGVALLPEGQEAIPDLRAVCLQVDQEALCNNSTLRQ